MSIAKYAYTAIDCPKPRELARFYSAITGWPISPLWEGETEESCDWSELLNADGKTMMAFQQVPDYKAPTWPDNDVPQQAHMDFHAPDLDEAEVKLLTLGAIKATHQVAPERFRVYLDPAGQPFCIVKKDKA
jgi:hypothetical protein